MNNRTIKIMAATASVLVLSLSTAGCLSTLANNSDTATTYSTTVASAADSSNSTSNLSGTDSGSTSSNVASSENANLDIADLFSDRDLEQTADLSAATAIQLQSGNDVTLNAEGIYVLSGDATNVTVVVDAPDDAKVQIVLDGVTITNENAPAIYVKAADKVFVTTTNSTNTMSVTGNFVPDGDTNLDAVIFSRSDLTLNGLGTLDIVSSSGNGISSKDDLKVTGGTINIDSAADSLEANDSIRIYDGTLNITTKKDALHSENDEDTSLGYITIIGGTLNISAADDAIRANTVVKIEGGTINIETCSEGIEGNSVEINGGDITIYATDDGINASQKVSNDISIVVNGGTIDVTMGSGDTDAFDSNGTLTINGGTINVQATSAFDADGTATLNGGTVTVNGEVITEITVQQFGGGPMGGGGPGGTRPSRG